jgi:uncharacterized metal-binding protein
MLEEKDACCGGNLKTLILGCAGGSNVGQISNKVMIELDKKGVGNAYCLAGIGADLSGFVESAKAANTILVDGCPVACGKKTLERHGIKPTRYIVITELGIDKNHNFDNVEEETKKALQDIL